MNFELTEITCNNNLNSSDCFPDFFDDCNPTDQDCMPNGYPDPDISEAY